MDSRGRTSAGTPASHQKVYVCIHVFDRERPVLLVSRADSDWMFLCGEEHPQDAASYRVAGIGHVVSHDPTLEEVLDLAPEWDAERPSVGEPWTRVPTPDEEPR